MNARPVDGARLNRLRWWYVPLALVPIPVLIFLGLRVHGALVEESADDSCSATFETANRAVFLLDLRKPVDGDFATLPGRLVDDVSRDLPANTEYSVYALSAYAEAPRTLIGRLCKPYENGDLAVEAAKDQRNGPRDCDDLPAQLPAKLRASASRFCRQREVLRRRVDALVLQGMDGVATDAYLVEALEEIGRDFADSPKPASLYVFSDLLQHAKWYSHIDVDSEGWDFEQFASARQSRGPAAEPAVHLSADVPVRVFYVARTGMTDALPVQRRHKVFWQTYFAGADLIFQDQPTMAGFASETLVDVPTPAELLAYEREQVRHRSELVDRARAELEQTRRAFEAERAQFVAQQRQLREQETRLAEKQRELAAQQREYETAREPNRGAGGDSPARADSQDA